MSNNLISSVKNTYQLNVDGKIIPFKVDISDIDDNEMCNLKKKYIEKLNKQDRKYICLACIMLISVIGMVVAAVVETIIPESLILYQIIKWIGCIGGAFSCITLGYMFFKRLSLDIVDNGWCAYQIASEIAFALDNMKLGSEIKLVKDIIVQKDPDIYLQIKDTHTKRINTYLLDSYSWEVYDKDEIVLTANRINMDDTTGIKPVYEMKLLVPKWIEDKYIVGRNLFA